MNRFDWIAVALLSGAATLPLAQGLPAAPGVSPPARTSMPLRTSGDTFTIDQKGQRTGDPLPDVDVSLGPRGPKSKAQGAVIPGGSVLQSGKAAEVGNVAPANVPAGGAGRQVVGAKPPPTPSAQKSFFESRSNTAVTGAPASEAPAQAAARKPKGSMSSGNPKSVSKD